MRRPYPGLAEQQSHRLGQFQIPARSRRIDRFQQIRQRGDSCRVELKRLRISRGILSRPAILQHRQLGRVLPIS
jgi:hypothetical protein